MDRLLWDACPSVGLRWIPWKGLNWWVLAAFAMGLLVAAIILVTALH
jgi:hypothetical protein